MSEPIKAIPKTCHDCDRREATTHYAGGAARCGLCSQAFTLKNRLEAAQRDVSRANRAMDKLILARVATKNDDLERKCEACHDTELTEMGDTCPECCMHWERDHGMCMECHQEQCPGELIDQAEYTCNPER